MQDMMDLGALSQAANGSSNGSSDLAATISAAAAVALVLTACVQVFFWRSQLRRQEAELIAALSATWVSLSEAWTTLVLVGRGSAAYYNIASASLMSDYVRDVSAFQAKPSDPSPIRPYLTAVRDVLGFLSTVSTHVMTGRISASAAYSVFGSGFLRHSHPLRILTDPSYSHRLSGAEAMPVNSQRMWCDLHPGVIGRVQVLVDILWAEAARIIDIGPSDLLTAARAKEVSWKNEEERFTQVSKRVAPARPIRRWILLRHLRHSRLLGTRRAEVQQLYDAWLKQLSARFQPQGSSAVVPSTGLLQSSTNERSHCFFLTVLLVATAVLLSIGVLGPRVAGDAGPPLRGSVTVHCYWAITINQARGYQEVPCGSPELPPLEGAKFFCTAPEPLREAPGNDLNNC